jgi:hypothetical protein
MGSSPRSGFGLGSRHDGKRFPGCLDVSARPSPVRRWSFLFPLVDISIPELYRNEKEKTMSANTASILRKYWKPALATGAGGTSVIIWFEEIILFGLDILVVLALFLLAGPIYLFNHFVFKSATPKPEDIKKSRSEL